MPSLPTGTVTFLFTDIEGSTTLLQRLGDRQYAEILEEHRRLLRAAFEEKRGQEVDTQGDAFLVAFSRARDAVGAAVSAQRALAHHAWPEGASLRVRMGMHTGEPVSGAGGYVGLDVHRAARICSAGHGGQILLSNAVEVLTAPDLPSGTTLRDLGTHRLKDLQQPEHLFQVVHPDLPTDFPPLKSSDVLRNNLPRQLTSFVGRENEIAEVKQLLSTAYLVTLIGTGGVGKTRLAIQVAADPLEAYADGVWLVELAALSDPALVPHTVASALRVPEQPGRQPTETLAGYLHSKHLLLLLDNCEHVLRACLELVDALLRACPNLRVLATSREPLEVEGEVTYRVPSLQLPDVHRLPPLAKLADYEAVRLFAERAALSQPRFALTGNNAPAVAQICYRLDGIPLAIEFAAARVNVLSLDQIAAGLDDRFRLLTAGSRKTLPQHQTLRGAMDWSYVLLSAQERAMLRWLSVFAGGWSLEAAEAICSGAGVEATDVLDLLTRLVDKSLVVAETQQGGAARYRLLETVRQYGRDRLAESRESVEVQRRHRDWYLALAERAEPELRRAEVAWLERLETENDNLRAALEWSQSEEGGADAELRIGGALQWFWGLREHWSEGRGWLEAALARSADAHPSALAKALRGAAYLAWHQGDYERATVLAEKGLALCRKLGDKEGSALLLRWLGLAAAGQGDLERSNALLEASLALDRELGDNALISTELINLAGNARVQGDYERAAAFGAEALALSREVGEKWVRAIAIAAQGWLSTNQGDYEQAEALFRESLTLSKDMLQRFVLMNCLNGLRTVAYFQGAYERAARLYGASDAVRESLGHQLSAQARALNDRRMASMRATMGDAAFEAAWAEGRAMTLEQAIEYALAPETG